MAFIVEIFRVPDKRDVDFRVHKTSWETLLNIAKQEGWKPLGTVKPHDRNDNEFENTYEPDYDDSKIVSKEDAQNLSNALEKVLSKLRRREITLTKKGPVIIKEDEINDQVIVSIPAITEDFLTDFVEYLKQGEFHFWWDE